MKNQDIQNQKTDEKAKTRPNDDFERQSTPVPDPSPRDADSQEFSGTLEDSYKAATAGTGANSKLPSGHPTEVFHAREEIHRAEQEEDDSKSSTKH